jgi:hypothetical protein
MSVDIINAVFFSGEKYWSSFFSLLISFAGIMSQILPRLQLSSESIATVHHLVWCWARFAAFVRFLPTQGWQDEAKLKILAKSTRALLYLWTSNILKNSEHALEIREGGLTIYCCLRPLMLLAGLFSVILMVVHWYVAESILAIALKMERPPFMYFVMILAKRKQKKCLNDIVSYSTF